MENCFLVSKEDYDFISKWYWRKTNIEKEKNPRKRYWLTNAHKEDIEQGYPTSIKLHQLIAERKYGKYDKKVFVPDHLNRNPDDNTRENLVLKTNYENSHNRGTSIINTSGKTGVYQSKSNGKWIASITVNYNTISLGRFDNFDEAVKARKKAEIKYGFTCDDIVPDYDIKEGSL